MATTQKTAPKKKGFQGVRDAIWIIVVCFILAVGFYEGFLGNGANFHGGDNSGEPANLLGTIYKGGIVVPVIFTLLFTVIALGVERFFALRSAFGKMSLAKFTAQIKAAVKSGDFATAHQLCDKMQGSVANVVSASLNTYEEMEKTTGIKKSQRLLRFSRLTRRLLSLRCLLCR